MTDASPALGGLPIVLGGNVFGWTIDQDQSFRVLDAFFEGGGRMIDTAEGYSNWVPGHKGGESEAILGAWIESRGVRADLRIATKTNMGGETGGLAPDRVAAALEGSLERLRTDYVDLHYAHRDETLTPQAEVAAGFDALMKAGKVRAIGASNFDAGRLAGALDAAAAQGLTGYSVLQPGFNLVWREHFPAALQQFAVDRGIAVLPYYGLASGFLTGKYRSEADFIGTRGAGAKNFAEAGWKALPVLEAIAGESGATMGEVALAWLRAQPAVHAPIASATKVEQVAELCKAATLDLSGDQLAKLDAVAA